MARGWWFLQFVYWLFIPYDQCKVLCNLFLSHRFHFGTGFTGSVVMIAASVKLLLYHFCSLVMFLALSNWIWCWLVLLSCFSFSSVCFNLCFKLSLCFSDVCFPLIVYLINSYLYCSLSYRFYFWQIFFLTVVVWYLGVILNFVPIFFILSHNPFI